MMVHNRFKLPPARIAERLTAGLAATSMDGNVVRAAWRTHVEPHIGEFSPNPALGFSTWGAHRSSPPAIASHAELRLRASSSTPTSAGENPLGLLSLPRRLRSTELDQLYTAMAPFSAAAPSEALRERLPHLLVFEPKMEPSILAAYFGLVGRETVELVFHVEGSAKKTQLGHSSMRIGTTWWELFNARRLDLSSLSDLQQVANFNWTGNLLLGFVFHADAQRIESMNQAVASTSATPFDYLARDGHDNCNSFASTQFEKHLPELGVQRGADSMHLYSALLWHNPRLKGVVVYNFDGTRTEAYVSSPDFWFPGVSDTPLYPDPGEHPLVRRLARHLEKAPPGAELPQDWYREDGAPASDD